jgi:hypothetical protein
MMYITMQWRQTHFVVLSYDLYFVRHIKRIGIYHVIVENNKVNCKEDVHLFTLVHPPPSSPWRRQGEIKHGARLVCLYLNKKLHQSS